MARPRKPARLYFRNYKHCEPCWVILDGARETSTGCSKRNLAGAQKALEQYLAVSYRPPVSSRGGDLLVSEVLTYYAKERMPHTARPDSIRVSLEPLGKFWAGKTIAAIKGQTCRDYVAFRLKWTKVAPSTARHDLVNLRAALNFYHAEYTLDALPVVTMPDKAPPRERWLDRSELARLLWAAWRTPRCRHVARFLLIGYYTGTRSTAINKLRWVASTEGGWFDLEHRLLYRKGLAKKETKKRQTPAKIHHRLLPHLYRWREQDNARGLTHVVHYNGKPVIKLRRSWDQVRERAGLAGDDVVLHTLRHSAATWLMQAGVPIFEAASYLGMSPETLQRVYAHQHQDFQELAAAASPTRKLPRNPPLKVIQGGASRSKIL